MTDTENDKFHKVLELVESLNFDEGTYVKICDSLKSIKDKTTTDVIGDGISDGEAFKTLELHLGIRFCVGEIYYCYNFQEYRLIRGSHPNQLMYSCIRNNTSSGDIIKSFSDCSTQLFRRLYHSKDITLMYFDDNGNEEHSIKFMNLSKLKRYFALSEKEECIYCGDETAVHDESEIPCGGNHTLRDSYILTLMLNTEDAYN